MTAPAESPPRPRRRRSRLLLLLVPLAVLAGVWGYLYVGSALSLRRAIAEADRLDPHWRLEDLQAERAAVPDEENGALTVGAVKAKWPANWHPNALYGKGVIGDVKSNVALTDRQVALVRNHLAPAAAALQEARKLADQPRGQLPGGPGWDALDTANLLSADVLLRAQEGDLDGALTSCRAIVNSGRSVGDEPALAPEMVRTATGSIAAMRSEHVLGHGEPSGAALAALQELLAEEAQEPLFTIALRGERASIDRVMESVQRGDMTVKQLRVTTGGPLTLRSWRRQDVLFYLPGSVTQSRAAMLRRMTRLVEISKLPPQEQADPLAEWTASLRDEPLLVRLRLSANIATYMKEGSALQARLRCAVVALAAERYRLANRRWPETLSDLKGEFLREVPLDPYDGQPLRIRKDDEGVVIYSVGEDHKDDGGNRAKLGSGPGRDMGFQLWDVDKRARPPK